MRRRSIAQQSSASIGSCCMPISSIIILRLFHEFFYDSILILCSAFSSSSPLQRTIADDGRMKVNRVGREKCTQAGKRASWNKKSFFPVLFCCSENSSTELSWTFLCSFFVPSSSCFSWSSAKSGTAICLFLPIFIYGTAKLFTFEPGDDARYAMKLENSTQYSFSPHHVAAAAAISSSSAATAALGKDFSQFFCSFVEVKGKTGKEDWELNFISFSSYRSCLRVMKICSAYVEETEREKFRRVRKISSHGK